MNIGFKILTISKLKIVDRFNTAIDEMCYEDFLKSPYSALNYKIYVGKKPWIKILEEIRYDGDGNIITSDIPPKHFALCKTIEEFDVILSHLYSTPLSELTPYETVVSICSERCESMAYVEEIADMFYRMGYIKVIEWEEIINQFEIYNKLYKIDSANRL